MTLLIRYRRSGVESWRCLRVIVGLENIATGETAIGERVMNDVSPKERDIGMVF
jgi:ABC-type sugar transport system ATPase subunit